MGFFCVCGEFRECQFRRSADATTFCCTIAGGVKIGLHSEEGGYRRYVVAYEDSKRKQESTSYLTLISVP